MSPAEEGDGRGWRLDDHGAIAALADGRHGDPFAILGPHVTPHGLAVRVFRPGAEEAEVIDAATGETIAPMLRRHAAGFFEGLVQGESNRERPYRVRFARGGER